MFVKNHFALQELGRNVSQTSDPQQSSSPASVVAQFRRKSPFSANATFAQDGMNPISWNIQTLRFVWYAELWGTSIFFWSKKIESCGWLFPLLGCHHAGVWLYAPRGDLTRRPSTDFYRWIQVGGALYSMNCSTSFNESCPHVHGKIGLSTTVCNNSLKECALQVYQCGGFLVPV